MMEECAFVRLPDGRRLAFVEQGPNGGEPVVLVHGYSDTHRSYDLMRAALPASWRVFALTLRGHGASDAPESGYAMSDFAADIAAFLDVQGIDRVVLVGHSMGAAAVLQAAADFPERVAGVALIGAFADFRGNADIAELAKAVAGFADPVDHGFVREFQESTLANPIAPNFLELAIAESLRLPAFVWKAAMDGMLGADPRRAAARCNAPALLVWGDRDAFVPQADQLRLRDALGSVRILTLAGVGHAVHWERPAETAAILRAFVAEIRDGDSLAFDAA